MQEIRNERKYSNNGTWLAYFATRLEHIKLGIYLDSIRAAQCKRLRPEKPPASRKNTGCSTKSNKAAAARMRRHDERQRAAGKSQRKYWAKPEVHEIVKTMINFLKLSRWKRLLWIPKLFRLVMRALFVRTEA